MPATRDATAAARAASLRWVSDRTPGIQRLRHGRGFVHRRPNGTLVGDRHTLARIRALVIPPAWKRVWICERPDGPKVIATLVRLLDTTMMRVGNEEYVRANGSYGPTTLRAWAGRLLAAQALAAMPVPAKPHLRSRTIVAAVKRVAARLGNTPAVCRRSYIHPAVHAAFEEGRTLATLSGRDAFPRLRRPGLERALLRLLAPRMPRGRAALRETA